jgi:hypothetical protein
MNLYAFQGNPNANIRLPSDGMKPNFGVTPEAQHDRAEQVTTQPYQMEAISEER